MLYVEEVQDYLVPLYYFSIVFHRSINHLSLSNFTGFCLFVCLFLFACLLLLLLVFVFFFIIFHRSKNNLTPGMKFMHETWLNRNQKRKRALVLDAR